MYSSKHTLYQCSRQQAIPGHLTAKNQLLLLEYVRIVVFIKNNEEVPVYAASVVGQSHNIKGLDKLRNVIIPAGITQALKSKRKRML